MFLLCQVKAVTKWFSFFFLKDSCIKPFIRLLCNGGVVSGVETMHDTAVTGRASDLCRNKRASRVEN